MKESSELSITWITTPDREALSSLDTEWPSEKWREHLLQKNAVGMFAQNREREAQGGMAYFLDSPQIVLKRIVGVSQAVIDALHMKLFRKIGTNERYREIVYEVQEEKTAEIKELLRLGYRAERIRPDVSRPEGNVVEMMRRKEDGDVEGYQ